MNWITPNWPPAGFAGFLMAALSLFLLVGFALYLPWYVPAAYGAVVVATVVLLPRWVRHSLLLASFAGVMILLVSISPLFAAFMLALVLGAALSLWVSHRREQDTRERDAFTRARTRLYAAKVSLSSSAISSSIEAQRTNALKMAYSSPPERLG